MFGNQFKDALLAQEETPGGGGGWGKNSQCSNLKTMLQGMVPARIMNKNVQWVDTMGQAAKEARRFTILLYVTAY